MKPKNDQQTKAEEEIIAQMDLLISEIQYQSV